VTVCPGKFIRETLRSGSRSATTVPKVASPHAYETSLECRATPAWRKWRGSTPLSRAIQSRAVDAHGCGLPTGQDHPANSGSGAHVRHLGLQPDIRSGGVTACVSQSSSISRFSIEPQTRPCFGVGGSSSRTTVRCPDSYWTIRRHRLIARAVSRARRSRLSAGWRDAEPIVCHHGGDREVDLGRGVRRRRRG
jgi:hypothetical protein